MLIRKIIKKNRNRTGANRMIFLTCPGIYSKIFADNPRMVYFFFLYVSRSSGIFPFSIRQLGNFFRYCNIFLVFLPRSSWDHLRRSVVQIFAFAGINAGKIFLGLAHNIHVMLSRYWKIHFKIFNWVCI